MTPRRASLVSGVLNVDKPGGMTSHDVVAQIRRLSAQRRVGHAGTLDPAATGVLVVCLGKATRLVEYITNGRKIYRARIRLGVETETWDAEGQVVARADCSGLTLEAVREALYGFVGEIHQVPPMYSALKHKGQPLYRLARRGIVVERQPRTVEIFDLELLNWDPPDISLRVTCSKGTYIRALAHDLGSALGTGAHLAALTRLAVGSFHLQDATPLDALLAEGKGDRWRKRLLPMSAALEGMPTIAVDVETARRIGYGQAVRLERPVEQELSCATDESGRLVAILRFDVEENMWRPTKVLAPSDAQDTANS